MRLETLLLSHIGLLLVAVLDANELTGSSDSDTASATKLDSSTLKLVHVLFRHGDRSQIHRYKNDIYSESSWPQGFGQLSVKGMQQEYNLGEFLRKSYVGKLLDPEYHREQVYARSTSIDRALMSAYSVLAALFPPGVENQWSEAITWQPIPVHTVPASEDYLLLMDGNCPLFVEKQKLYIKNNLEYQETFTKHKDIIEYISKNSGEEPRRLGSVADTIFCQNANGFPLPQWVTPETLKALVMLQNVFSGIGWPPQYSYLKGGILLGQILNNMIDRTQQPNYQERLYLYSAHDSTVAALMTTLGVFNNLNPPYTAAVIFELHQLSDNRYAVQILYRNDSGRAPYVMQVPGCEKLCPLDKFGNLYVSSLPLDIKVACQLEDSSWFTGPESPASTIAAGVMTAFLLLMVLIIVFVMWLLRGRIRGNHDYSPVPMEMSDMDS